MLLCLEEALEHFSDCSIEATRPMPGKNSGVCLGIILVLSVKGKAATLPPLNKCNSGSNCRGFLYGNWTVPGWFCGDPLLHLIRGGESTVARESTPTPPLPSERRGMRQGKSHRGDRG
jgi:hypothetical protein